VPLGPYKDFDAAVRHFIAKGDSPEVARKKAGAMKQRIEGSRHIGALDLPEEQAQAASLAMRDKWSR